MNRQHTTRFIRLFALVVSWGASVPDSHAQAVDVQRGIWQSPSFESFNRGLASYSTGDYRHAEEAFQETLRVDANLKAARYWLGMCYYQQSRLSEAKTQFLSLTGTLSSYAKAYDGLGLVYLKEANRGFEALEAFRQAATLDPADADVFYHIGLAYMHLMTTGPPGGVSLRRTGPSGVPARPRAESAASGRLVSIRAPVRRGSPGYVESKSDRCLFSTGSSLRKFIPRRVTRRDGV